MSTVLLRPYHFVVLLIPVLIASLAYLQPFVPSKLLFLDPLVAATLTEDCCQTYLGIVSNLGVFLWFITAASCLLAAYILWDRNQDQEPFEFALLAGLLTAWLALDDAFLLHENIAPKIGIPQSAVLLAIAAGALIYAWRCRHIIFASDVLMFVAAIFFLALSLAVDVVHISTHNAHYAVEDGAKLIGIVCWAVFHIATVARLSRERLAEAAGVPRLEQRYDAQASHQARNPKDLSGRTVLLLGNYRPTLTVARQLKKAGARVISGWEGCDGGARVSRYVDEIWDHSPLDNGSARFVEALQRYIVSNPAIDTVIPVSEEFVRAIADHKPNFSRSITVATADQALVKTCLDKPKMLALCDDQAVPTAPHMKLNSPEDIADAARNVGFPMVVRPAISTARIDDQKAVQVERLEQLQTLAAEWDNAWGGLVIQAFAEGSRHNVYFASYQGDLRRLLHAKILRTDRPDGSGLAVEGTTLVPDERLVDYTKTLLRSLNYSGIGCAQFLVDEDTNSISFLEINPRLAGNHAVPERCGLDLTEFLLSLVEGDETHLEPREYGAAGIRYCWLSGDLNGLKSALRNRKISVSGALRWIWDIPRTFVVSHLDMMLRADDPLPGLLNLLETLPFVSRLTRYRQRLQRKQDSTLAPTSELANP